MCSPWDFSRSASWLSKTSLFFKIRSDGEAWRSVEDRGSRFPGANFIFLFQILFFFMIDFFGRFWWVGPPTTAAAADEQPLHHTRSKEDCIGGPILSFDELGLRAQQSKRVDGLMPRQSDISRMAVNEPGKRASSGTHRKNFERLLVAGSVLYLILTLVLNSSLAKNAPLWVSMIGAMATL